METTIHLLARSFYRESIKRMIARNNIGVEIMDQKKGIRMTMTGNSSSHLYLIESQYSINNDISNPILFLGTLKQLYQIFEIPSLSRGGYITPADGLEVLPIAIDKIIGGEWFISPCTRSFLESGWLRQQQDLLQINLHKSLTRSEIEILSEIAIGNTTSEIALKRFRSVHTVKTQRKEIRRKLSLTNQYNLNGFAAQKRMEIKTLSSILHNPQKVQFLLKYTA